MAGNIHTGINITEKEKRGRTKRKACFVCLPTYVVGMKYEAQILLFPMCVCVRACGGGSIVLALALAALSYILRRLVRSAMLALPFPAFVYRLIAGSERLAGPASSFLRIAGRMTNI